MKITIKLTARWIVLSLLMGLVVAWTLVPAAVVYAHADMAQADPPPDSVLDKATERITIWFTEPVEPKFSEIRVLDAQGQRVDKGDSAIDPKDAAALSVTLTPLPHGTYTVAWRNVSAIDGHSARASFVFSVGEPISGPLPLETPGQHLLQSPLEPVFHWLTLLSLLAIVGGLSFELLIVRPAYTWRGARQSMRELSDRLSTQILKFIWLALGVFLLASLGQLLERAATVQGLAGPEAGGSPLFSLLLDTGWGQLYLWRIGLLAATAALLGLGQVIPAGAQSHGDGKGLRARLLRSLALLTGAGTLLTLSLTSHGAATAGLRATAVFSDYLHLLAAGLWVGGLFHLALALPLIMRTQAGKERHMALAALVPRFSAIALLSVGSLVITGLYSAYVQVTMLRALATPYGLTLLAKVSLLLLLLLVCALLLLWVRPRLMTLERAGQWLRRLVTYEALLALVLLFLVGVLISLEPARQVASRHGGEPGQGLVLHDIAEGAHTILTVEPGLVGQNRLLVSLSDRLGNPVSNASDVSIRFTFLDAELGENTVSAPHQGEGNYQTQALFSIAGSWQAELMVRRPDAFDAKSIFRFDVSSGQAATSAAIMPSKETGRLLWGLELALLGLLFMGTSVPLRNWWTRAHIVVLALGAVALIAGFWVLLKAYLLA